MVARKTSIDASEHCADRVETACAFGELRAETTWLQRRMIVLLATLLFVVGLFITIAAGVWAVYWSTDSGLNAKFDAMHRELGEVSRQLTSIEDQLAIIEVELTVIGNGIRELIQDADERKDQR